MIRNATAVMIALAAFGTVGTRAAAASLSVETTSAHSASATTPAAAIRRFEPRDIFALQRADDVQISPDGQRIVYVRSTGDILTDAPKNSLWMVEVATGVQSPFASDASSPRWSPDGSRIAYLSSDAKGQSQVFVRSAEGGDAPSQVTRVATAPGAFAWSPDGRRLAFSMFVPETPDPAFTAPVAEPQGAKWTPPPVIYTQVHYQNDGGGYVQPGHTQLFVVSAHGGDARQITSGPFDVQGAPGWTADGRDVLFSSNRLPGREGRLSFNSQIFRASISGGALSQITHRSGVNAEPVMSPDGRLIAYTGFDYDHLDYDQMHLYVMAADGSQPRQVDRMLDRDVHDIHWAADGRGLYISYGDHGETTVAWIGLDGRTEPLERRLADSRFTVSATGVAAFGLGATDRPAEVAVTSRTGQTHRLTRLNAALLSDVTLGEVRALPVASTYDGEPIGAWVATPPGYVPGRRYPTLLLIHGGPYGDVGPQWITDVQVYAAAGYVVLYSNPRGSTSYGFAFAHQLLHPVPGHDYDDLMSVVDTAIAKGVADPDRLFVTGGSYGGLMTAWIVGKTNRFRAAVAEKPIVNFTSESLSTDQYAGAELETGHLPWNDPAAVWSKSPLSLAGTVQTPTMLMVGEDDRRTPATEAEQFYGALQLRGVPTALVLFPGASHETLGARPSQLIAEDSIIMAWFRRYGGV